LISCLVVKYPLHIFCFGIKGIFLKQDKNDFYSCFCSALPELGPEAGRNELQERDNVKCQKYVKFAGKKLL
jgi:hypothetical protein